MNLHAEMLLDATRRTTRRQARAEKLERIARVHSRDDGERAMARRRRQIAAGSLTVANGLVTWLAHQISAGFATAADGDGGDVDHILSSATAVSPIAQYVKVACPAEASAKAGAVHSNFSPAEHANFVSAKVVAHATAFLEGRNDAAELGRNARAIMCELIPVSDHPAARGVLDPARLLVVAMLGTALAQGLERQDRWQHVMGALVELVRHESHELRRSGVQRS